MKKAIYLLTALLSNFNTLLKVQLSLYESHLCSQRQKGEKKMDQRHIALLNIWISACLFFRWYVGCTVKKCGACLDCISRD